MELVSLIAMPVLLYKLIDFIRYAVNLDRNGVVTQLLVWLAGIVTVVLYANSDLPDPSGLPVHQFNIWSQLIIGLQLGSAASAGKDVLKAVDNNNSVKIPTLLSPVGPAGRHRAPDSTNTTNVG